MLTVLKIQINLARIYSFLILLKIKELSLQDPEVIKTAIREEGLPVPLLALKYGDLNYKKNLDAEKTSGASGDSDKKKN